MIRQVGQGLTQFLEGKGFRQAFDDLFEAFSRLAGDVRLADKCGGLHAELFPGFFLHGPDSFEKGHGPEIGLLPVSRKDNGNPGVQGDEFGNGPRKERDWLRLTHFTSGKV